MGSTAKRSRQIAKTLRSIADQFDRNCVDQEAVAELAAISKEAGKKRQGCRKGSRWRSTKYYEVLEAEVMNLIRWHHFLDGSTCEPPLPAKTSVHAAIERTLSKNYRDLPEFDKARAAAKQHLIRHFDHYDKRLKRHRWVHSEPKVTGGTSAVAVGACNITAHGRAQSLTDWARESGLSAETIRERLKSGWAAADAVLYKK